MKLAHSLSLLVLSFALILAVPVTQTGCSSTQSISYRTLATTEAGVDAALKAFADARVHGRIDDGTYAKVDGAYAKYQIAFAAAVKAAQLNLEFATPKEVSDAALAVINAINAALGKEGAK